MYLVRKITSNNNLYKLRHTESTAALDADILNQELRTSGNTLSFWKSEKFDCLDDIKDTLKAILLSTTGIKASQFIVVEERMLEKYGLLVNNDEAGITGYNGYESLHINLIELTYEKVGIVLDMLREVVQCEEHTPKLGKEQVKQLIAEVKSSGLLNMEALNKDLRKDIEKYLFA